MEQSGSISESSKVHVVLPGFYVNSTHCKLVNLAKFLVKRAIVFGKEALSEPLKSFSSTTNILRF